jgi:hypothetical protein
MSGALEGEGFNIRRATADDVDFMAEVPARSSRDAP